MSRKTIPEINAGSMADIAFLLLIFFLVTTTLDADSGILKKIPKKEKIAAAIIIKDRNLLEISVNYKNQILINQEIVSLPTLTKIVTDFIDNGGGLDHNNLPCNWCNGPKNSANSDHPSKAFIKLDFHPNSSYETYIAINDQINNVYKILRNKLSVNLYHQNYESLLDNYKKSKNKDIKTKQKIMNIIDKYPILLSDL